MERKKYVSIYLEIDPSQHATHGSVTLNGKKWLKQSTLSYLHKNNNIDWAKPGIS